MKAGKLELEIDVVPLSSILEKSVESLRGLAETRGISFVVPDTEAQVLADSGRVVQVAVNIISNALKFSPDGSTITLSVLAGEAMCEVRITDQGKGIAPADQKRIFARFEQAAGDESRGTGLGLAICKTIIEQHGGNIGVESQPGAGSTFWFTLPAG